MISHRFYDRIPRTAFAGLVAWAVATCTARAEEAQTAQYDLFFDAVWSAETHPDQFPSSPHFSGLIGGTHNESVSFWKGGEPASDGMESMAETGGKSALQREVQAAIDDGTAEFIVSGPGIGRSPGSAAVTFNASQSYPLLTLVSMIAPSPDWFVGVSGLDLLPDGKWLDRTVIDLFAYDAGTDSGPTYQSPNDDTNPPGVVTHINESPLREHDPLGKFTVVRRVHGDYNASGSLDADDIDFVSERLRNGSEDPAIDLNGDGANTAADREYWVTELANTSFGDSNLDGTFDSSDLVAVFQAGEYENNVIGDSRWATGDWDGDGEFASGDLVAAFQAGGYTSRPPATAVPEPQSLLLLWPFALALFSRIRQRARATAAA